MANWSDEQLTAITGRDSNMLVAAAAGSGKTAVLVERVISLVINDRLDIDRLLIVTFTQAAAGEMRQRISAALLNEMEKNGGRDDHLRRQLNLINRSAISTMHAFCTDVIRSYFHLIDIDPRFRIADDNETALLKLEAVEEVLEDHYEQENQVFLGLVEMYASGKHDLPIQEMVLRLYEFIQSQPYPLEWLEEKTEYFNMDAEAFEQSAWVTEIGQGIRMNLIAARDSFSQALQICRVARGLAGYEAILQDDIGITDRLLAAVDLGLNCFSREAGNVSHGRLGKTPRDTDEDAKETARHLRDDGKTLLKKACLRFLAGNMEELLQEIGEVYPYMRCLHLLVHDFTAVYSRKKLDKGILDFGDLEHYALKICSDPQAARAYREKYDYIFVDEYQDSNLVQETILSHIKRDNNLFLVGDVKQSIYRFRLADPSLFMEKYQTYEKKPGARNLRIDLSRNFRSQELILAGVNCIFKHIMSPVLGELEYTEEAFLIPGLGSAEACACHEFPLNGKIELCLLERMGAHGGDSELEEWNHIECEARLVAGKIKEIIGQQIYDYGLKAYRPLEYRDIVILQRSNSGWINQFVECFISEGIPVYADINSGYFDALEVGIFLNLLRVVDNRKQDIPLISVMRSPLGDFSVDELAGIRIFSQTDYYYQAVDDYRHRQNDDLALKINRFFEHIEHWQEAARYMAVDELVWKIMTESDFFTYVGAMPGGLQRQANLKILLDRARQFEESAITGLFNFIKYIDRLQASRGDMGMARILGENENLVRIMSIHRSKGLEFPVVIVAGMGRQFNTRDSSEPVLIHKDLGLGPRYVDINLRCYHDTLARVAVQNRTKLDMLSEEMRILYVACTRPKNKLIMIGSIKDLSGAVHRWRRSLSPFNLSRGKNFLDWVGPVVLRHRDGLALRALMESQYNSLDLIEDTSQWHIQLVRIADISADKAARQDRQAELQKRLQGPGFEPYSIYQEEIKARLHWQYPWAEAARVPTKLSATEIKQIRNRGRHDIREEIPVLKEKPVFMRPEGERLHEQITGAERGQIIHLIMQHLDFSRVNTAAEIARQLEQMQQGQLLSSQGLASVNIEKIRNLFLSGLGRRILAADRVKREMPFNLVCRAGEIMPGFADCLEEVLVQGVIDLYFEEDHELVLVDYKTDGMGSGLAFDREYLIKEYRSQIEIYRQALEKITGKRVKASFIYAFALEEAIEIQP